MNKKVFYNSIDFCFVLADYVIAFFILAMTASAWCYDANIDFHYVEFNSLFLKVLILYFLLTVLSGRFKYVTIRKVNVKRLVYAAVCIGVYAYLNTTYKEEFTLEFILTFAGILVWMTFRKKLDEIWDVVVNVVTAIAIVSLVFYVFGSFLQIIPAYYSFPRIWGTWAPKEIRNFYYLYYESQQIKFGSGFILWRNCGIFAESPMYNFVLCIALAAETFIVKKKSRWKAVLLIVTVITTFCTTGQLFLVILALLYLLNNNGNPGCLQKIIRPYIKYVAVAAIVICILLIVLKGTVFGRGSTSARMDHMLASLKSFTECIVYGCGWNNREYVWQHAQYKQGLSVGLPYFMACGGLLLSSVLLIPVVRDGVTAYRIKQWNMFFFEVLFVQLFFFTIVMNYPVFLLGLGYMLVVPQPARTGN